ncbi:MULTISPECIES: RHS repeat-associated core domain-containing protein [Halomonadaceae]|uniref:Protein RhsD n=1 Tax=Vreelandella titanicae TaxID=664683 RepID=A0AAP9T185_9GAMM|nr:MULTISPECIES: RHS repeat-associated core domain-containing protein [Halomonas]QKS25662.1 Protein RhsD [Halomonas titanicae]CDG53140.1 hypothetical protein HALA3H3_470150 [Halomonas sp. A3H3]|tara:strand:- start:2578 stop:3375 length:798 start_codon:yes stop_codon:yes gene_type:complete
MLRIDDTEQGQVLSAYITDALGTPMQLVTTSGQPRWLAEPDDWAAVKNQRAVRNVTQPIRFQGQWHDEESGLYYNRHRYYDPQQGRYISQDPIGLNGGTNLYGYVTNPTGMVDPLGLFGANMHHLEPFGVGIHASNPSNTQSPAVAQPPSEWEFVEWEVLEPEGRLERLWTDYKDVRAVCSDQHGNSTTTSAKYFQTRPMCVNEICRGGGPKPDAKVVDTIFYLEKANSHARGCGGLSKFECFMQNEATPDLGAQMCENLRNLNE